MNRLSKHKLIGLLPLAILAVLVFSGLKTFVVWTQVTDYIGYTLNKNDNYILSTLYEQKIISDRPKSNKIGSLDIPKDNLQEKTYKLFNYQPQPEILDESSHTIITYIHSPRVFLVSPSLIIGENFNWSMHRVFSLQILIMIFLIIVILMRYYENEGFHHSYLIAASSTICGLSLLMNGRLIFALLAGSSFFLLVSKVRNNKAKCNSLSEFILCGLFLILSTVSTGVYAINHIILFGYFLWSLLTRQRSLKDCLGLIAILFLSFPLFYLFVRKNLLFFGGDFNAIWKMLGHGYGVILKDHLIISFLFIASSLAALYKFKKFFLLVKFEFLAVILGIMGGVFGYSTTAAAIIPLILSVSTLLKLMLKLKNTI